ncbi:MAG: glycerophosphodiester phosphodiesterase [Chitinophagaceae bacterium]|nr:MAG: glycerophosphodiester phosphodiesterase [Chitinophagaceae bacterium]
MNSIKSLFLVTISGILFSACSVTRHTFDAQAHRGGRGLMPENTIASEKNAINYSCTMEMDLQMTKDKKVVVSHDAYMNALFCLTPEGDTMSRKDGYSRLIFDMPYDSLTKYDCGSKPYPAFPQQKRMYITKPLLSVLIDSVEAYGKRKHHINHYNIEIKSNLDWDGKHYTNLQEYVDSAMAVIMRKGIAPRTMVQSFDVRALRMVHKKWPKVTISYLVGAKDKKPASPADRDVQGYIDELGFKPDVWSPEYVLVTSALVKAFHKKHILVIPWTPDTVEEMQKLKDMGVDGEITDYPNYYAELK